jgi:hypothetical protein
MSHRNGAIAVALSVAGLIAGAALPAQAATTGWREAFSTHYGADANNSVYNTIVATSGKNAWAFGGSDESYGNGTTQQIEGAHWTGSSWHTVSLPTAADFIVAASAPAASDIWAVTAHGDVLHYNGESFPVAHRFGSGPQQLTGVLAFSARNVWTFGSGGGNPGYGAYHYNGSSWKAETGDAKSIFTASAVSASDIWAIDGPSSPQSGVIRYNGSKWVQQSGSALSGVTFRGIEAVSASSVWITATSQSSTFEPYLLHYNGKSFSKAKIPWSVEATQITSDGRGGLWILAHDSDGTTYALHRTSKGAWSRTEIGPGDGLSAIPGTAAEWAVGSSPTTSGVNAAIWEYGKP